MTAGPVAEAPALPAGNAKGSLSVVELHIASLRLVQWKPIASAPKDGRPLLLWLAKAPDRNYTVQGLCDEIAIGFWLYGGWKSIEVEDCGSMGGELTGWMPDWVSLDLSPTHWMPLPDAPLHFAEEAA